MKHCIYLAGAITGKTFDEAIDWRNQACLELNNDRIECLSPLRGKDFLKNTGLIKAGEYAHNALTTSKGITRRDQFDCLRSSCVLMNLLGADKVSVGSVMEAAWCFGRSVPLIIVMEKNNVHHHVMIEEAATYIVETLHEGFELIHLLLNDSILEAESWLDMKGYEESYVISSYGRIRNKKTGKFLMPQLSNHGHLKMTIPGGKRKFVHRLVAQTFLNNPNNLPEVNHKNGIKTDNKLSNLEWITRRGNQEHAWRTGLNSKQKTPVKCIQTGIVYPSIIDAAKNLGLYCGHISEHLRGKHKHVGGFTFQKMTLQSVRNCET
jgi:hypothetical protein